MDLQTKKMKIKQTQELVQPSLKISSANKNSDQICTYHMKMKKYGKKILLTNLLFTTVIQRFRSNVVIFLKDFFYKFCTI